MNEKNRAKAWRSPLWALRSFVAPVAVLIVISSAAAGREYEARAEIVFEGTSTLHDFAGRVSSAPFKVMLHENVDSKPLTMDAAVKIHVADMTTDHQKRDRNMRKLLQSSEFDLIEGEIIQAPIPAEESGNVDLRLKICDQVQVIHATLKNFSNKEGAPSFDLSFPVSLKAFALKAPSVVGVIRVGDEVRVECRVLTLSTSREGESP